MVRFYASKVRFDALRGLHLGARPTHSMRKLNSRVLVLRIGEKLAGGCVACASASQMSEKWREVSVSPTPLAGLPLILVALLSS